MDIYKKRTYLNTLLAIFGLIVLIITMVYSNYLAQQLKEREDKNTKVYVQSIEKIVKINQSDPSKGLDEDMGVEAYILDAYQQPLIIETENGELEGFNWSKDDQDSKTFLESKKQNFLKSGKKPIKGYGYMKNIYYFNSPLLSYIKYYPYIQILLVGSFILLGFFFLTTSKKAEQNRVWAGMAKETAHQLGTPISAIIGWIEHLKYTTSNSDQLEIIGELRNDVHRLELVADRFSKIGSEPILTKVNIYEEMEACRIYMERRASRNVIFDWPSTDNNILNVKINKHLFDWVIENLIRNSLDALGGKGTISAKIFSDDKYVIIDLIDTGKGISSSMHHTVFQPGYTTKKRGWGLGLSLAKRIIVNYHSGKIFVKYSSSEGTTFTIKLPKMKNEN
ncbi:MAG: HAMP domain-containing sensor histidine kinase [Saprospiraceae bacterium]